MFLKITGGGGVSEDACTKVQLRRLVIFAACLKARKKFKNELKITDAGGHSNLIDDGTIRSSDSLSHDLIPRFFLSSNSIFGFQINSLFFQVFPFERSFLHSIIQWGHEEITSFAFIEKDVRIRLITALLSYRNRYPGEVYAVVG